MRIIAFIITLVVFSSCGKMRKNEFIENYESVKLVFSPEVCEYNYNKTKEGYELTFSLETLDI